jgi:aspartyl-tRNA(Asn)/glutamyl-tRNA(Gln) amidotransferase subunit A
MDDPGSVIEIAERVRAGESTALQQVEDALARIELRNESLNAFVHLDSELARTQARDLDARISAGEDPGPLAGVPIGVKDVERVAGMPATRGSLLHVGSAAADADGVHVSRLRAAGAIPLGMTAMPEFGTVAFTRSKAWGVTRNPWNPQRTPGGSSGGSAAAVAAGMVPLATAGDGGGSTRIPAAYSGLVGHKPSFGRIPREGATTSQTAVWGSLVTTVADAARHLDVACGPDDRDRTSLPPPGLSYERAIEELDVRGLRALWSPDLGFAAVDPEIAALSADAAGELCQAAELERVERPVRLDDLFKLWAGVGAIDIWLQLGRDDWPARADELTPGVRRGYEATEAMTSPRYARLLVRRTRLEAAVAELFADIDVLITPTTATPAFAAEGPQPSQIAGREVHPAMAVPFTMLANLCWNPAISVPIGQVSDGLPAGLQIMTRRHLDEVALRLARILEQARPWTRLAP